MPQHQLARLTAMESRALLDSRQISATSLLDAIIERHQETHDAINAVIALDLETARLAAIEADRRFRQGRRLSPLDGIPITVKDNIGVRGMVASWGSKLFADRRCDQDDVAVERVRNAGAVIWGKTNTPEFALAGTTENGVFGVTRNPRNRSLTPGGSSGGAAAALAAGVGALALATDAGGSARRPAAYTGTVGFRPSNGRIPRGSILPNTTHDLQVLAPMARTVGDARLLYSVLAGPDPRDRLSLMDSAPPRSRNTPLRIRVFGTVSEKPVEREITETLAAAADQLRELGHSVAETAAPFDLTRVERIWSVLISTFAAAFVRDYSEWHHFSTVILGLAKTGAQLSATDYRAVLEDIHRLRRLFDDLFEDTDILLCPTSPCFPWLADAPFPGQIDAKPATLRDTAIFLAFVNIAGLPAISLPAATRRASLPTGLQLVAGYGHDERLLDIAEALEHRMGRPYALPLQDL
jgi:aspartyl-tRNA(Asn)/glutamyl-tRNA(Gln) amidotransferase subunit A